MKLTDFEKNLLLTFLNEFLKVENCYWDINSCIYKDELVCNEIIGTDFQRSELSNVDEKKLVDKVKARFANSLVLSVIMKDRSINKETIVPFITGIPDSSIDFWGVKIENEEVIDVLIKAARYAENSHASLFEQKKSERAREEALVDRLRKLTHKRYINFIRKLSLEGDYLIVAMNFKGSDTKDQNKAKKALIRDKLFNNILGVNPQHIINFHGDALFFIKKEALFSASFLNNLKQQEFNLNSSNRSEEIDEEKMLLPVEKTHLLKHSKSLIVNDDLQQEIQQIWDETKGNKLEKILALLDDYVGGSQMNRFFTGRWNRHHITEVENIARIRINSKCDAEDKINHIMNGLENLYLENKAGYLANIRIFLENQIKSVSVVQTKAIKFR